MAICTPQHGRLLSLSSFCSSRLQASFLHVKWLITNCWRHSWYYFDFALFINKAEMTVSGFQSNCPVSLPYARRFSCYLPIWRDLTIGHLSSLYSTNPYGSRPIKRPPAIVWFLLQYYQPSQYEVDARIKLPEWEIGVHQQLYCLAQLLTFSV